MIGGKTKNNNDINKMENYNKIEKYIYDFFSNRHEDFGDFYRSVHNARQIEIYRLNRGAELMDLIINIHSHMEERYCFKNLIPHIFATPEALIYSLNWFKQYLNEKQNLLDINYDGENTSYIVNKVQEVKNEIVLVVDYVKKMYDSQNVVVPYQDLRYKLITREIEGFVAILTSIFASISYAIFKTKEGYYHSNAHVILKLLGFDIITEESTNRGRIDAVIRFSDTIYIFEFKFSESEDLSDKALNQIKEKGYHEKFILEKKEIIGVGISFSEELKNINGFKQETLNQ
jgi:hypothetical protein